MSRTRRWQALATLGFGLLSTVGCQTWVPAAGLTLPSGRYLQHPPQYIPPSPDFPLTRELAAMEGVQADQAAAVAAAAAPVQPPPQAPVVPPPPPER